MKARPQRLSGPQIFSPVNSMDFDERPVGTQRIDPIGIASDEIEQPNEETEEPEEKDTYFVQASSNSMRSVSCVCDIYMV